MSRAIDKTVIYFDCSNKIFISPKKHKKNLPLPFALLMFYLESMNAHLAPQHAPQLGQIDKPSLEKRESPQAPKIAWYTRYGMTSTYKAYGDIALYLALMVSLVFFILHGASSSGYDWQWYRAWRFIIEVQPDGSWSAGLLLQGLGLTLLISALSLVLALFFSCLTVMLRRSHYVVARTIAIAYVEAIRNTPLLIQIFVAYFVFAPIFDMDRFSTAVLALALFEGAYMAEILRSGFDAVPEGQWEASRSLGMDERGTIWQVIVPQALRRALPPLTGQAVSLIKDSSLVSVIALHDLTMNAQMIISETFLTFEIWFITASLYLMVTIVISGLASTIERRLHFDH